MPVRLIAIDVDGTLVGTSGIVAPKVWEAADRARARGIRLAIASGRPAFGTTGEHAARLDPTAWHVFQNGASILDLARGVSKSAPIPEATIAMLVDRRVQTRRCLELYTDTSYASEGNEELARAHAALLGVRYVERAFAGLAGAIVRAQWLITPSELDALIEEAHPDLEVCASTSPMMQDTLFVNLTVAGITKASAIRTIAAEYGYPLSDVMHVGDSGNDLEALRTVGWPVAMHNAEPDVRASAKHHVVHVDDGGAIEAIDLAMASWDD
ncbi:Cof-type HAD-IIB family hydrolase [soil metagenome]